MTREQAFRSAFRQARDFLMAARTLGVLFNDSGGPGLPTRPKRGPDRDADGGYSERHVTWGGRTYRFSVVAAVIADYYEEGFPLRAR